MKCLLWIGLLSFTLSISAQSTVDGSFPFETDPDKKYSYYIPSNYDETVGADLMVGLHPFNTSRWDAKAWRDTLIVFAETNNLILICPDGGADGRVDDPIDTAFTSAIIDSMELWFNTADKFLIGFSVGGKTVYSYGLRRIQEFEGFIPIGSAISGSAELQGLTPFIEDSKWYLVHGSNDNPNTRFYPALEYLNQNNACTGNILMPSVGHTIDFPDRNEILTEAFNFIKSEDACEVNSTWDTDIDRRMVISPNPNKGKFSLNLNSELKNSIRILNAAGKEFTFHQIGNSIDMGTVDPGIYYAQLTTGKLTKVEKFVIVGN